MVHESKAVGFLFLFLGAACTPQEARPQGSVGQAPPLLSGSGRIAQTEILPVPLFTRTTALQKAFDQQEPGDPGTYATSEVDLDWTVDAGVDVVAIDYAIDKINIPGTGIFDGYGGFSVDLGGTDFLDYGEIGFRVRKIHGDLPSMQIHVVDGKEFRILVRS